ncbi:mechanosensitive ion channel family protein [Polycladomyces subterraneus]|uniref:Mechanosensitive ion channel family protein n=1 Tax=Polycladomyces subterraneus TaxID=1016997 RepID=A0ABT8IMK9_9BACL|nr:mechanosensitive ion channel family protein [Polycladomyces subterraneus]MDN4594035.1 mechanosensitive ion channel family protein [Polycladomyces subterraneus]
MESGLKDINPWRRIAIVTVILVVLSIIFDLAHDISVTNFVPVQYRPFVKWGIVILWFIIGVWLLKHLNYILMNTPLSRHVDPRTSRLISRFVTAIGYIFIVIVGLSLLHINLSNILVGGAVTGVIVGIAAQSTLSNLFAGIVLLTVRPFSVGQFITLRTYLFGGIEYRGTVIDVNWYYTVLIDKDQKRILPNSSVIVSAITLNPQERKQVYIVPIPYSVSQKEVKEALSADTDGRAMINIREFMTDAYNLEIHLPSDMDPDLIRKTLAKYRQKHSL